MLATRAGARVIPIIGWMALGYDAMSLGQWIHTQGDQKLIELRGYGYVGAPEHGSPYLI